MMIFICKDLKYYNSFPQIFGSVVDIISQDLVDVLSDVIDYHCKL